MKYGCLVLFLFTQSMAQDAKQGLEDRILQWRWYKSKTTTIHDKQLEKKGDAPHLFDYTYIFPCKYAPKSNHELLVMRTEILKHKEPFYSYNFLKCKWMKYFHSFSISACYGVNALSNDCSEYVFDMWYTESEKSHAQKVIRDRFFYTTKKQYMPHIIEDSYAVSDDCRSVAFVTHEGVVYINSPGNELTLHIPNKHFQDVAFCFAKVD